LRKEERQQRQKLAGIIAGTLKLFAQQRRNDMGAEAVWQFMGLGDRVSVDEVAEALDWLRAEGHYDRVIAEATAAAAAAEPD
jgi:hypothetical protein